MNLVLKIARAVVRRLPSHGRERLEEFALPLRPFERLELPSRCTLTVTCDDGELRDLDIVEVLDRHGAKGTFAVSPDLIGRPGFLSYEQLRQIRAAGHEIAFHGTTHDPFTSFAGPASLQATFAEGISRMQAEGLGEPSTLIYPYGRTNRWVREAVSHSFDGAFTTWFGFAQGRVNRYAIRRIAFGAYTGRQPASEAWYQSIINRAVADGGWPTLMLHPAAEGHTREHTALLSRLLEHARERGVPIVAAATHLGALRRPPAASTSAGPAVSASGGRR